MALDPATIALLLGPTLLQGIGSFFDDTSEQQLGLSEKGLAQSQKQFEQLLPLRKGSQALQAGGVLSDLLGQQTQIQSALGRGAGLSAAGGFPAA